MMIHSLSALAIPIGLLANLALAAPPAQATRPNFVFILGEGHGWSSTSVRMDDAVPQSASPVARTPNLEKLAQSGMRFANFYAPSPRCTPSRATYFTGLGPAQLHMTFVGEGAGDSGGVDASCKLLPPRCVLELPESTTTLAELLKRAGYATAHFGKWHVGKASPATHGFDESDGATSNGGPDNVANPHPQQLYGMTQRGIDFMARQVQAGRPFYLQLSHYASRKGGDASPEAIAKIKSWGGNLNERALAQTAADLDLDTAFGMLLQATEKLGIGNHTYVLFTTDHGSPGRTPPLSGGKGTVSEGGLRVPFIIRGPGIQPGTCSHVRAVGADLFPTIADLARVGEPLPKGLEGGSLVSVLTHAGQGAVRRPREEFVVHFPHYDKDAIGPASALLLGDLKLVRVYETGTLRLFDIAQDPGERCDLAAELPDKTKELDQRLTQYLTAVNAQLPAPNPKFDPSQPPPATRGQEGKARRKGR
jgi:arylsulfatase A-like enzyme